MTAYEEALSEFRTVRRELRRIRRNYSWGWIRKLRPEELKPSDRQQLKYLESRLVKTNCEGANSEAIYLNGEVKSLQLDIQRYIRSFPNN